MTRFVLDVASYQGSLKPADVRRAGFTAVNLKISHGLGLKSVHPDVAGWARSGLDVCTFHFLTADASGAAQARYAYARMQALGVADTCAHQLDTEATPGASWRTIVEYLIVMRALLSRPVALYSGDWWWTAPGRGWDVSDLTPYLWSAPVDGGYVDTNTYPGDTSPLWTAGYAGIPRLSIMQYVVGPLIYPDGTRGSIDVSKSAIRDEAVWTDLTTRRTPMTTAPASLKAARLFILDKLPDMDPLSVGIVGDDNHARTGSSYHLGESALRPDSYTIVESPRDRAGLSDDAAALDVGWFSITVKGVTHTLRTYSVWLVAQCQAGAPDTLDIREVIYSPDGKVVKRWDRLRVRTTGPDSHLTHTHQSYFRDSTGRDKTALFRRYFTEIGLLEDDDMTKAEFTQWMTEWAGSAAGRAALGAAVLSFDPGVWPAGDPNAGKVKPGGVMNPDPEDFKVNPTLSPGHALNRAIVGMNLAYELRGKVDALNAKADQVIRKVTEDDGEATALIAQINSAAAQVPRATLDLLGAASGTPVEQVAASLAAVLGDRASAVGRLLTDRE